MCFWFVLDVATKTKKNFFIPIFSSVAALHHTFFWFVRLLFFNIYNKVYTLAITIDVSGKIVVNLGC